MMPKVSVLMNCYNGEKYLTQAIDSVFNQTFEDWEIIFVDNCSTDNSAEIAKSYKSKLKHYKTDQNIPLGAARNFGLKFCQGEYVTFLDVDDIWLPDALENLIKAITSGNYAFAYGGQIEIDSSGKKIGETMPTNCSGNLLDRLLLQFDIPIVASIVDKQKLVESNLSFDNNIKASEEYCLYMQLALRYDGCSISKNIVKYRIHNDSLTKETIDIWFKERDYTLKKLREYCPSIVNTHKKAWLEANARSRYYEVQYLMKAGLRRDAIKLSFKNIKFGFKYFIIFIIIIMPKYVWKYVQKKKYRR